MSRGPKVLIFGAGGRVGMSLAQALMCRPVDLTLVDFIDQSRLAEQVARISIDSRLSGNEVAGQIKIEGGLDVLNEDAVAALLAEEQPDIVVNYAIPFTWDATKALPNYERISRAGLGAFAAVQVLAPRVIARALATCGSDAKFIVGNLPDITIPILYGLQSQQALRLPVAGAGNVGLIEAGLRHQIALERGVQASDLDVSLVAHHIHWVAPREPGYPNDAPFLLKVCHGGSDITGELGDLRDLINRSIINGYEAGAGFSSTTGLLAARLVTALLDEVGITHRLHSPAPNGLPGGYPTTVQAGKISVNLPPEWQLDDAVELMYQAHRRDGINRIGEDGSIHFNPESVQILDTELGIKLPQVLAPSDLEAVAEEQIKIAQAAAKM